MKQRARFSWTQGRFLTPKETQLVDYANQHRDKTIAALVAGLQARARSTAAQTAKVNARYYRGEC